jgi:hypothetical protein
MCFAGVAMPRTDRHPVPAGLKPISGPRQTSSPRPQQYALARHHGIPRFTGSRLVPSGVMALVGLSGQDWTMLRS